MNPLSVAPMIDRTDRHYRFFMRQISQDTLLYTEMITTGAILHGDRSYLLGFDPAEHPLSLQLGGDDPAALAECARIAVDMGYDEINLNVGCPSSRVQSGHFGAVLMLEPHKVARAVEAMRAAVDVPVTVKHRIGVDEVDQYEHMLDFVDVVAEAGCTRFTVHARKAWLSGLSPKENRNIPPLRYDEVYRLKQERPHLEIEINGGIKTAEQVREQLKRVDAVMLGRAAYDEPWLYAELQQEIYGRPGPSADRFEVAHRMIPYVEAFQATGQPAHRVTRHMLQLFSGVPGAKAWKRFLTVHRSMEGRALIEGALQAVEEAREAAARRTGEYLASSTHLG